MITAQGGGRRPTIYDVADRAGVSKSLVSLVLQKSPRVSEEKRQAVLKAVAELGYRPDPVARSLAERRTRTIGVVIDDLSNPWYVELLDGLRPVLHEHGLRPLLADGRTEPDAVQALVDLRVDGLVLVGTVSVSAHGLGAFPRCGPRDRRAQALAPAAHEHDLVLEQGQHRTSSWTGLSAVART